MTFNHKITKNVKQLNCEEVMNMVQYLMNNSQKLCGILWFLSVHINYLHAAKQKVHVRIIMNHGPTKKSTVVMHSTADRRCIMCYVNYRVSHVLIDWFC